MTIKIKETVERNCCESKDLKKYTGEDEQVYKAKGYGELFCCSYCGQLWERQKYTNDAGCISSRLRSVANIDL